MTSTSDERREVAERLRENASKRGVSLDYLGSTQVASWWLLLHTIGCNSNEQEIAFRMLANLIEPPEITEDTSDGFHTFGQLYYQRMVLFAVLVQEHKDCAWKTWNHEDGEPCFGGGWFLVTIDTPRGAYGYHFEKKHWKLFDCPELPKAKHWDGYTEKDANRLFLLNGYEVSSDAQ